MRRALEDPEVDALIAIFACVASCDPGAVTRAIRRAAVRAERATGVGKPLALCLMGETGAVRVAGSERPFPSYRFPEAAAMALARAAEYAAYRRRPPGRLVFFDDVDAIRARAAVEEWLHGRDGVELAAPEAEQLLAWFGLKVREGHLERLPASGCVAVRIRPHPQFGPILELERRRAAPSSDGRESEAGRAVRITPLTDRDAEELAAWCDGVSEAGGDGVAAALLRLSQMVEEIPWSFQLEAALVPDATGPVRLTGVRIMVQKVGPPAA
ncbi:MAG: hypothetical protein IMX02_07350 [Limnochordaceae bacterium]|nr:hypothetical protein [Limnochordaceae bacterium]